MEVVVIRSPKRRKTAQARLVDGRLEVRIPARASKAEEARLVGLFQQRFARTRRTDGIDLDERARVLARRYDLPRPTEIRWVSNQAHRWGSCTPSTGVIRLSDRMAGYPPWVVDAVIVHELAHLVERGHGPRFKAITARYPLGERADGYLLAMAGQREPDADPMAGDLGDLGGFGDADVDEAGDEAAAGRTAAEPLTDRGLLFDPDA